jgi:hypothetical protein
MSNVAHRASSIVRRTSSGESRESRVESRSCVDVILRASSVECRCRASSVDPIESRASHVAYRARRVRTSSARQVSNGERHVRVERLRHVSCRCWLGLKFPNRARRRQSMRQITMTQSGRDRHTYSAIHTKFSADTCPLTNILIIVPAHE